ncbi:MAG: hypothetical protein WCH77_09575, partial [Planctomycetota bacterium]
MGRPLDDLLTQFVPSRPRSQRRSIFSLLRSRRPMRAMGPLPSSHLTLAAPESLEIRKLWAVDSQLFSGVLTITMNLAGDTAFVRELGPSIVVANSAINVLAAPINTYLVSSVTEIRVLDIANVTGEQFNVFTSPGLTRVLNVPSGGNVVDAVIINAPLSNRVLIASNTLSLGAEIRSSSSVDLTVLNGNLTTTTSINGTSVNVSATNGSLTLQQQLVGSANVVLSAANDIQTIGSVSATNLTINSTSGNISLGGTTTAAGAVAVNASKGFINVDAAVNSGTNAATFLAKNDFTSTAAITSGALAINSSAGNVSLGGATTASGVVAVNATQGFINVSAPFNSGANPATFLAKNDFTSTAAITSGALTINSSAGNVSLGGTTNASGGLTVRGQNNVSVNGTTNVTGGDVSLTAVANGVSIQSGLNASANDVFVTALNGPINIASTGSILGKNVSLATIAGPVQIDGAVTANLSTGLLTLDGPSNASNPNATLGGNGTLSGQCLAVYMFSNHTLGNLTENFTSLTTNVSNILGFVNTPLRIRNGSAANLTVSSVLSAAGTIDIQSAGNIIVPSNLAVAENSGLTLNSTGGSIQLNASLLVSNAPVVLTANGSVSGTGLINVSGWNANLSITAGRSGGTGSINVTTRTSNITARVNGTGDLRISEYDGLSIASGNVSTASGNITITAGSLAAGNLNGNGLINAGGSSSNVMLTNTRGGINLASGINQVTAGNLLTVTAQNAVNISANVANLTAMVTGSGEGLTLREANGLGIVGSVSTSNGLIDITAGRFSVGNISGNGLLAAGTANVTITNTNGAVTLNGVSGQITGNVLNVTAQNSVAVNTNVSNATVNVTGFGQSANIQQLVQLNGLNVTTVVGDITVNLAAGNLLSSSGINASNGIAAANVTLGAVAGNIAVGTITANRLNVTAQNSSSFTTNITSFAGNITGAGQTLTATEFNGLTIDSLGIKTANGAILITAGNSVAGSLNGTGNIIAGTGNVTLTNTRGGISLTGINQVTGNVLTISAQNSVVVNTSVQTLNASVTNASATLTVNDSNGLGIQNATT